ncbi:MAG: hypothetical protein DMG05_14445 [Acidobacteria bacterium]|nr:MAG: hypothetical protein DMG05_14445 [Acidobacteriota bacterium]
MLRRLYLFLCPGLLALLISSPVLGAPLKAGVAKADITPPQGVLMWGYANRKSPAKGTLDPLYARVLALDAGEKRLVLVALDLGRTFGPASLERLRQTARKSNGVTYVLVAASHTHSGPVMQDEYAKGVPAWETAALEKIGKAIVELRSCLHWSQPPASQSRRHRHHVLAQ